MALRPRIYYNAEQKAEMWDRWHKGQSLSRVSANRAVFYELRSGPFRGPPTEIKLVQPLFNMTA